MQVLEKPLVIWPSVDRCSSHLAGVSPSQIQGYPAFELANSTTAKDNSLTIWPLTMGCKACIHVKKKLAIYREINIFCSFQCAVADGFHELLASRRNAGSEDNSVTMAHLSWSLHIWVSRGNSRNRTAGKDYILANKERRVETQSRIHGC